MSLYDIIMLAVLVGAVWFGFWKGLAWQIASVAAIVVSYFVSINFREQVAQFISAEEPWNRIAAMLILFLLTSLVIWTIYASVHKSLKKMELKGFDRQAGALLGAAKGVLLCMVITMFSVSLLGNQAHDAIHNSRSGRYIVRGITQLSAIVPEEIAEYTQPHVDKFHEAIGHDGNLPMDQYPQFNQSNQMTGAGQGRQDPSSVPSYRGQWQVQPASSSGGGFGQFFGQSNQNTQQPNASGQNSNGFTVNWNSGQGGQAQASGNGQRSGTQNGSGQVNNGWPDVNFQVNTKEVFDAAAEAARQRLFESPPQR